MLPGTPAAIVTADDHAYGAALLVIERVRSVTLCPAARPGHAPRRARTYTCDAVCYSGGVRPADDLAYQALASGSLVLSLADGAAPGPAEPYAVPPGGVGSGQDAPGALRQGLWLAGLVAGAASAAEAVAQGEAAGSAAASRIRGA